MKIKRNISNSSIECLTRYVVNTEKKIDAREKTTGQDVLNIKE